MARYSIRLPKSLLVRADTPQLMLAMDSLFGRVRDLGLSNPMVYAALGRIAVQLAYRFSSERWREEEGYIVFQIDLADWERDALREAVHAIIMELRRKAEEYRAILSEGRARNPSTVESRIAALELLVEVITQIVNGKKMFKPLLREG